MDKKQAKSVVSDIVDDMVDNVVDEIKDDHVDENPIDKSVKKIGEEMTKLSQMMERLEMSKTQFINAQTVALAQSQVVIHSQSIFINSFVSALKKQQP